MEVAGAILAAAAAIFAGLSWRASRRLVRCEELRIESRRKPSKQGLRDPEPTLAVRLVGTRNQVYLGEVAIVHRDGQRLVGKANAGLRRHAHLVEGMAETWQWFRSDVAPFAAVHGPPRRVAWYDAAGKRVGSRKLKRREVAELLSE